MEHSSPHIAGELASWPTKDRLAAILRDAGLRVTEYRYSLRVDDCSHFVFQHYGGDLGDPCIDADADSVPDLMRDAERVSLAISRAGLAHRLEVYDEQRMMVGYFHHDWPRGNA
jgi:hypothetical protein